MKLERQGRNNKKKTMDFLTAPAGACFVANRALTYKNFPAMVRPSETTVQQPRPRDADATRLQSHGMKLLRFIPSAVGPVVACAGFLYGITAVALFLKLDALRGVKLASKPVTIGVLILSNTSASAVERSMSLLRELTGPSHPTRGQRENK